MALDKAGVPTFEGLRLKRSGDHLIVYFAFDLLTLEARDLTQLPLTERKAASKRILPRRKTGGVRFTGHVIGNGEQFFQELEKMKLEGMISKRADSLYVSGRTPLMAKD